MAAAWKPSNAYANFVVVSYECALIGMMITKVANCFKEWTDYRDFGASIS